MESENKKNMEKEAMLKKELEKQGYEKLQKKRQENKTTVNVGVELYDIMKEGSDTFKKQTGKNLCYLEIRELYG